MGAGKGRCPALAALVVLALAAAACGATGTAASDERVLRVVMADDWAETGPVVSAIRDFEHANPGVRVDIRGVPFPQIPDNVRASIESGDPVDVAQWHPFAAAAQGMAEPVDELWEAHGLEAAAFLPGAVADVEWAGRLYGVPLDTNAALLLVNRTLLADAGISPDALGSFADLRQAAEAVTNGAPPGMERRGIAVPASSWATYAWIRANGGEIIEIAATGEVTFTLDDPRVVGALDLLGSLVAAGVAYPPNARDNSGDAFALFRAGSAVMHASGTWDVAALENSGFEDEVTVVRLPGGESGSTRGTALGGSGLFIPKGAADPALAFAFMEHLTSDPYALRLAREEGRLPARRSVFEDEYFDEPILRVVTEELEYASPMRLIAFPDAQRAFEEAIDDVLTNRRDAASALREAQRAAQASLEEQAAEGAA